MATGTIIKPFVVEKITFPNSVTIDASGTGVASANVSKSGYTPVGIISIDKSGSGQGSCIIQRFGIAADNVTAEVGFYNMSTASRTITVIVRVLYQHN